MFASLVFYNLTFRDFNDCISDELLFQAQITGHYHMEWTPGDNDDNENFQADLEDVVELEDLELEVDPDGIGTTGHDVGDRNIVFIKELS
jgi:hypothetical protein